MTPLRLRWPRGRDSLSAILARVRDEAARCRKLSDAALEQHAASWRASSRTAACIEPALGMMCEALRRTLGLELYDVQLQAGLAMAGGAIAEMQTGEGKTLAASLPAFFFAAQGKGVHVATPNAYLAQRDFRLLSPALNLLGCSVGLVSEGATIEQRRAAYAADITYATGYDLGFDYLRDRLAAAAAVDAALGERQRRLLRGEQVDAPRLQRGHASAILDEIDSVLIDEACTPLVLAEAAAGLAADYRAHQLARHLAEELSPQQDFLVDPRDRQIQLSAAGVEQLQAWREGRDLGPLLQPWADYVRQALFALHLLVRDIDYVVAEGRVALVDEFTGRIFADRSWQDGLHQAVEAKEGLTLHGQQRVVARITRQRFFRQYRTLCGTTGTAQASRRELWQQYRLPVVEIPLAHACRRRELPDRYFTSLSAKWRAIVRETAARHSAGQPVLIASRTIETSLHLAQLLAIENIPFRLLNGRQNEAEAAVIARAGEQGAVTVATNMAGRGTDIRLGGGVSELGGLHLIAAERNESTRIDRQLIGRVARQGEPGSCQFFISAEDSLLERFAPHLRRRMAAAPQQDGEIFANFSRKINSVQRRAEALACQNRRRLVLYDDWLVG